MSEITEAQYTEAREAMVEQVAVHVSYVSDRIGKKALSERVMQAMGDVLRHVFVPKQIQPFAYLDQPLPIGSDKTISQPFIVALMTDLLDIQPDDHVLEIGTGMGYQAAILSLLADTVYSVEILSELAEEAEKRLQGQGFDNIKLRLGDGSHGWVDHAPFDKIIVTAAPELIPVSLLDQLKSNGKMVIPAGDDDAQQLLLIEKDAMGHMQTQEVLPVVFSRLVISH